MFYSGPVDFIFNIFALQKCAREYRPFQSFCLLWNFVWFNSQKKIMMIASFMAEILEKEKEGEEENNIEAHF